jgi:hypothetical protein
MTTFDQYRCKCGQTFWGYSPEDLCQSCHDAEHARRRADSEAMPKPSQKLLLTHLTDCAGQRTLFEEEP